MTRLARVRLGVFQLEDRTTPSGTSDGTPTPIPPTANDDFTDTDGTNPVTVSVLGNDAAAAPATLNPASVTVVSGPARGSVAVNAATGEITYTATGFFMGTDSFRYTVADSNGTVSSPASVTVVINRPTANDDFAETDAGVAVAVDVLGNDTDPDGNQHLDPATVTVVSPPAHGAVSVNTSTGAITYTPAGGFTGTDTFRYTITDDAGAASAPGTVSVVVRPTTPPPSNPAANDDIADTDGTNPVSVDVLANDTAPAGQTLQPGSVVVASNPTRGTVSVDPATGAITYTASGFFKGTDQFTYTVHSSGGATSAPAYVTVVINRPTANDDFADTDGTNPVPVSVLDNDTDPDGNDKIVVSSVNVVTQPTHGSVSVDPATGAITYTAAAGFRGTDTFRYTITDDAGAESAPGTVTVVVNRPTANDDAVFLAYGTPQAIPVLANDTDPDGNGELDPTAVKVVSTPLHGTATPNSDGTITYTPAAGSFGTDRFTYTVTDLPGAESNVAEVVVRVRPPAVTPVTAVAADAGGGPRVTVFNADGTVRSNFFAFDPAFTGGVRIAVGDVNADGVADVVAVPGEGGGPQVAVFDGATGALLRSFFAYDPSVRGGLYVAVGDVTDDGVPDIVTGAGAGGAPHVKVFDGATGAEVRSFYAYDPAFRDGVTVAVGDVTGDGVGDIVTGAGALGGPEVAVFNGATGGKVRAFYAFDPGFRGGIYVAVGNVTGDATDEIIVGAGVGGGPVVGVFNGRTGTRVGAGFVYDPAFRGGVRVGVADVNQDGTDELVVGPGSGAALPPKVIDPATFAELTGGNGFDDFAGGVFVGGA